MDGILTAHFFDFVQTKNQFLRRSAGDPEMEKMSIDR